MRRVAHLTAGLVVFGAGVAIAAARSSAAPVPPQPQVARVMVHCPAGNREAFVTPPQVRVRTGGTIEWRMNGQVASDSIVISLKDGGQAWPFSGAPSRGGQVAVATSAGEPGTYGYNVRLLCRIPNEGVREVVIDPDIIITP
jgi:plastocyanin